MGANIAEGNGRHHRGDYLRFLSFANGSLSEVENYLHLLPRLGYVTSEEVAEVGSLCGSESRMLLSLARRLRA